MIQQNYLNLHLVKFLDPSVKSFFSRVHFSHHFGQKTQRRKMTCEQVHGCSRCGDIINLTRGAIVIQATKRWTRPFAWSLGTQRVRIDRAAPPCTPAAITRPLYQVDCPDRLLDKPRSRAFQDLIVIYEPPRRSELFAFLVFTRVRSLSTSYPHYSFFGRMRVKLLTRPNSQANFNRRIHQNDAFTRRRKKDKKSNDRARSGSIQFESIDINQAARFNAVGEHVFSLQSPSKLYRRINLCLLLAKTRDEI